MVSADDTVCFHMVKYDGSALVEGQLTGVDVHLWVGRGLVGVRDTGEVGNDSSASLFVKSFDITAFANFERGRNVALVEFETRGLVDGSGEVSVS